MLITLFTCQINQLVSNIPAKMRAFAFSSLCFFGLFLQRVLSHTDQGERASLPPRGWNSYDSFCWTINETEFLQNAQLVAQRLKPHGYEYVVVDYLWYRRKVKGANTNSRGFDVIDEWGRMVPDLNRWPSSQGGKGFTEVALKVHSMGLKFGIHVMRGISFQAFDANTPVLDTTKGVGYVEGGRQWRAKDIGIEEKVCGWMNEGFMAVNTKLGAGRAFLRSLYQQYAEWGVDFVKHDCVFGEDLDSGEITYVSDILKDLERPILYSISPGTNVTPEMAKNVSRLVNMYRITGDDWDRWEDIEAHFNESRDFADANMIGAEGLLGKSWPDLDMLPLGWLTQPDSNLGPHRKTNLTLDEQKTQMTLWSIAKSPIMFGGDMRALDDTTFGLITNPTILEINHFSSHNMEFPYVTSVKSFTNSKAALQPRIKSWVATGRTGEIYVAFFNLNANRTTMKMEISDLAKAFPGKDWTNVSCDCEEVWSMRNLGVLKSISLTVQKHGTALFLLNCTTW